MSDDLISRQAAIDALNSLEKFSLIDRNEYLHGVGVRLKFAVQKLEQLPSAQPEQRWIPVTERLPEPYSGKYLVTINDGSIYTDILWFDAPGDGRYESCFYTEDDGYGIVIDDVTAWMHLPEPYKGDEENAEIH